MIRKTLLLALFGLAAVSQAQSAFDDALSTADEVADDAGAAADDALATADGALDTAEDAVAGEGDENKDAEAATVDEPMKGSLAIGIMSCIGVLWWFIFGWFVYAKTNSTDTTMRTTNYTSGVVGDQIPLTWFWTAMDHPNVGYTAISYMMIWWTYLIVQVVEFIGWILWITNDGTEAGFGGAWFYNMWASYVGLYGSWILYFLTVLMPILQLSQNNGDVNLAGQSNAIMQLVVMFLNWLAAGMMHIFYVPSLNAQFEELEKSIYKSDCKCGSYISDAEAAPEVNAKNLVASTASCSEKLNKPFCRQVIANAVVTNCQIEKGDLNDEEFAQACGDASMARCTLARAENESDMDYMIKCKVQSAVQGKVADAAVDAIANAIEAVDTTGADESEPDTTADW